MKWFRFYAEVLHDPKVQKLPPQLFKHWVNILCLAAQHEGKIPNHHEDLAFTLRISVEDALALLNELIERGLVEVTESCITPHNWDIRQYKSDISTERVKRFRNGKRNGHETFHETFHETKVKREPAVSETAPDTDTDTEQIQKQNRVELDHEAEFLARWNRWPSKGRTRQPLCQQQWCEIFMRLSPEEAHATLDAIDAGLDRWLNSRQFEKGFVFAFADFLAQRRWQEEPEQIEAPKEEPLSLEEQDLHWDEFQRLTKGGMNSGEAQERAMQMIFERRRRAKKAS